MENSKIIKFNDFDNIEYRKGSNEFGSILTMLMDFLRMYNKEDMEFSIEDFEEKSNIKIENIEKLINDKKKGNNLFLFDIELNNGNIYFTNFINGKSRPFESNNI